MVYDIILCSFVDFVGNADSTLVTLNLVSCFLMITVKLTVRRKRLLNTHFKSMVISYKNTLIWLLR